MIVLNAPVQQDKIIETLTTYNEEGLTFEFIEKKGMKLYFNTNATDLEATAKKVKEIIKETPYGAVLYFQVTAEWKDESYA